MHCKFAISFRKIKVKKIDRLLNAFTGLFEENILISGLAASKEYFDMDIEETSFFFFLTFVFFYFIWHFLRVCLHVRNIFWELIYRYRY